MLHCYITDINQVCGTFMIILIRKTELMHNAHTVNFEVSKVDNVTVPSQEGVDQVGEVEMGEKSHSVLQMLLKPL